MTENVSHCTFPRDFEIMTDKVTLVVVGDADVGKSALAVRGPDVTDPNS
jgi:GTPase SAR1 family protein